MTGSVTAVYIDAIRRYLIAINEISLFSSTNASRARAELETWFDQRRKVWNNLNYAFSSFIIFTGPVVTVSTILLWRAGRVAGIRDKVVIIWTAAPSTRLL